MVAIKTLFRIMFCSLFFYSCGKKGNELQACLSNNGVRMERLLSFENYLVDNSYLDGTNKQAYVDLVTRLNNNELLVNECDLYKDTGLTFFMFIDGGFDVVIFRQMQNCVLKFYNREIASIFFDEYVTNVLKVSMIKELQGEINTTETPPVLSVDDLPEVIFEDDNFRLLVLCFICERIIYEDSTKPCDDNSKYSKYR